MPFLSVCTSMRSVPLVRCYVGAISSVFVLVRGQCLWSGVRSAPFPWCSSEYTVGAVFITYFDVPGLLHLAFSSDIVSTIHLLLLSRLTHISKCGSFPPFRTQHFKPKSPFGLHLWWNGAAGGQRAHHQHSASPLVAYQKKFVRRSGSGLWRAGRGWEDVILPGCEDPWNFGTSEWDQKMGKIECVICCMIRWSEMRSIYPGVFQIYTPCGTAHICFHSISGHSCRPAHFHYPGISAHLPSFSPLPSWMTVVVRNWLSNHIVFMHGWFRGVSPPLWALPKSWYHSHIITTHKFNFDIVLHICSVVGLSDNSYSYQFLSHYILLALHY